MLNETFSVIFKHRVQMVFMAVLIEFQRLFFVVSCLSLCLQTNPDVCHLLMQKIVQVHYTLIQCVTPVVETKNRTTQISIKSLLDFQA